MLAFICSFLGLFVGGFFKVVLKDMQPWIRTAVPCSDLCGSHLQEVKLFQYWYLCSCNISWLLLVSIQLNCIAFLKQVAMVNGLIKQSSKQAALN